MSEGEEPKVLDGLWKKVVLTCLATAIVCLIRRPDQLLHPDVWQEDGSLVLVGLLERGLQSLTEPINGYICLLPRLIGAASLSFGLKWYPVVGTWLAVLVSGLALATVAFAPTYLRGGGWLVLAVLLVPTDPECFGLPLYSFWFAGLCLFLLPVWRVCDSWKAYVLRLFLVGLCGLSSPFIVPVSVLLAARATLVRTTREASVAALAAIVACYQLHTYLTVPSAAISRPLFELGVATTVLEATRRFFGYYITFTPDSTTTLPVGVAVCVMLASAGWLLWKAGNRAAFSVWLTLSTLLGTSIILGIMRAPLTIINPVSTSPRYFFYPFILTSWLMLHTFFSLPRTRLAYLFPLVVLVATVCGLPLIQRRNDSLSWGQSVARLNSKGRARLRFHTDGRLANVWQVKVKRCLVGVCVLPSRP